MNSCLFSQYITVLVWLAQLAICSYSHTSDSRDIPPGDTPFKLCNDSSSSDILSIDMIQLHPKPLLMDQVFHVNVYGTFSKDIPLNSAFTARGMFDHHPPGLVFVKDFCYPVYSLEQPDMNRTQECPPEKGWALTIFEGFTSPWDLPAGPYFWKFEASTPDDERIYCVEAEVCLDYPKGDPRSGDACPPDEDGSQYVEKLQQPLRGERSEARSTKAGS